MNKYQSYSKEVRAMIPRAADLGIFRENPEEKNNPRCKYMKNVIQCKVVRLKVHYLSLT